MKVLNSKSQASTKAGPLAVSLYTVTVTHIVVKSHEFEGLLYTALRTDGREVDGVALGQ